MRKWTDEQLIKSVKTNDTMIGVIRSLGLSESGGNHVSIRKHINRLNLDTSHFLGKAWVRNPIRNHPNKIELTDILVKDSTYSTSNLRIRLIKEGIKEEKCEICKLTEWLGEKLSFELDHINGDRYDHRLENLRILCPNCHSQTETWRGRNKKSFCECGTQKNKDSQSCLPCFNNQDRISKRRFEISKEELERLVWEKPTTEIAKEFGVSDSAISKRCKKNNIQKPPRGYWSRNHGEIRIT